MLTLPSAMVIKKLRRSKRSLSKTKDDKKQQKYHFEGDCVGATESFSSSISSIDTVPTSGHDSFKFGDFDENDYYFEKTMECSSKNYNQVNKVVKRLGQSRRKLLKSRRSKSKQQESKTKLIQKQEKQDLIKSIHFCFESEYTIFTCGTKKSTTTTSDNEYNNNNSYSESKKYGYWITTRTAFLEKMSKKVNESFPKIVLNIIVVFSLFQLPWLMPWLIQISAIVILIKVLVYIMDWVKWIFPVHEIVDNTGPYDKTNILHTIYSYCAVYSWLAMVQLVIFYAKKKYINKSHVQNLRSTARTSMVRDIDHHLDHYKLK